MFGGITVGIPGITVRVSSPPHRLRFLFLVGGASESINQREVDYINRERERERERGRDN